jgi:hypothetical protein
LSRPRYGDGHRPTGQGTKLKQRKVGVKNIRPRCGDTISNRSDGGGVYHYLPKLLVTVL